MMTGRALAPAPTPTPAPPTRRAPTVARGLLRLGLGRERREFVIGDIEEEYFEVVLPRSDARAARWWYWKQVVGSIVSPPIQYGRGLADGARRWLAGSPPDADGMVVAGCRGLARAPTLLPGRRRIAAIVILTLCGAGAATTVISDPHDATARAFLRLGSGAASPADMDRTAAASFLAFPGGPAWPTRMLGSPVARGDAIFSLQAPTHHGEVRGEGLSRTVAARIPDVPSHFLDGMAPRAMRAGAALATHLHERAAQAVSVSDTAAGSRRPVVREERVVQPIGGVWRETVTIEVINRDFYDVNIWAHYDGLLSQRLGVVTGNTTKKFTLEWQPRVLYMVMDVVGAGVITSEDLSVDPGDELQLELMPDIHRRAVPIRRGIRP